MKNKSLALMGALTLFIFQLFAVREASAEEALSDKSFPNSAVTFIQWPAQEGSNTSPIKIIKDTSQVLRFDRAIKRVSISNPAICDLVTIGDRDVLVNSKQVGTCNLLIWDETDTIATYELNSTPDLEKVWRILQGIDSAASFNIVPYNQTAAVYGTTSTSEKLKEIQAAVKAFDANALCYVRLKESKQVMLEVRFAEVNRNTAKDFKLDVQAITPWMPLTSTTGQTGGTTDGSDTMTMAGGNGVAYTGLPSARGPASAGNIVTTYWTSWFRVAAYLKWLESKNILKIIARPNLLAKDGEEATFLVGGELPIPVSVASGGSTTTSIIYKQYGTKLKFTPTILDDDVIRLKTEMEISEIDPTTSVGSVPAMLTRNNQTVAELHNNESLVIGGIITQRINRVDRKMPFLSEIPIFGKIFKANEFQRQDVELLVVITPHLIEPMPASESNVVYDPVQVKETTRAYKSEYADINADAMHQMMTKDEVSRDFEEDDAKKFADVLAKRMGSRSGRKNNASAIASPPIKSRQAREIPPAAILSA